MSTRVILILVAVLIAVALLRSTQSAQRGKKNGVPRDVFPDEQPPEQADDDVIEAEVVESESQPPQEESQPEPQPEEPVAPEPPPEPASAEQSAPKPTPSAMPIELTPEALAARFFAKPFPSAEDKAVMGLLAGRSVEWSGVVRSVFAYQMDFTFGNQPGVRVSLELCEIAESYGMKRKILAAVSFPPSLQEELKSKIGRPVRFRASILSLDPVVKEIRLTGGILL